MTTKKQPKKKPNPQDATLRNIRALKKRCTKLEGDVLALEATLGALVDRVHGYLKGKK